MRDRHYPEKGIDIMNVLDMMSLTPYLDRPTKRPTQPITFIDVPKTKGKRALRRAKHKR